MTALSSDTLEHAVEHAGQLRSRGDRRHVAASEVVSILMLVIQFGAIVWGASALKSSVDELRITMVEMTRQLRDTQSAVNSLTVDVGILKDRSKLTLGGAR